MELPEIKQLSASLQQRLCFTTAPPTGLNYSGSILDVGPTLLRASLPGVSMGELCRIEPVGTLAEVVAIEQQVALLSPFSSSDGLSSGQSVSPLKHAHRVAVGSRLKGRILDGLGQPIDEGSSLKGHWRELDNSPPDPLTRKPNEFSPSPPRYIGSCLEPIESSSPREKRHLGWHSQR